MRYLLLILVLLSSSCSLHRFSQGALLGCSALDLQGTILANQQGRPEINPLFRNDDGSANIARLAAFKAGSMGAFLTAQELDSLKRRNAYTAINVGIAALHCTATLVRR